MGVPTADNLDLLATKNPDDLQRHEAISLLKHLIAWRDDNLEIFQLGVLAQNLKITDEVLDGG